MEPIAKRLLSSLMLTVGLLAFPASGTTTDPLTTFLDANPDARAFHWEGRLSRLTGPMMATGNSVEESAWNFLFENAAVFGASINDLIQTPTLDDRPYQPVLYDRRTGQYRMFAVYFSQIRGDVPVFKSNLTVVVRNEPGFPVVHAVNDLHNLGDFAAPQEGVRTSRQIAEMPGPYPASTRPELVIYVDPNAGEQPEPVLAYQYVSETGRVGQPIKIGINGEPVEGTYDKRLIVVDATTGRLLHQESMVHSVDVIGNVSGMATPGVHPDDGYNPPQPFAIPNVRVEIVGGNWALTNHIGDFVIPHSGNQAVTVRSRMVGPSLSQGVSNQAGSNIVVDLNVTPPGPAIFEHNAIPAEFVTSQVNAMLQTSLVHIRMGEINPQYPGLNRNFVANVNISSSCNAYYNGSSINFYRRAGSCVNTAYSTVVYHEYGHKLVGDAGTNQGAYGEGMSDCIAILMTEDPVVGRGFYANNPNSIIRDARAGRQYPCSGGVHFCGQVLSGCVWHTLEAIKVSKPSEYMEIISDLTLNSILFRPPGINPGITIDFLVLDDDDNNLRNGTPHYHEINHGFSLHNMPAPPLELLEFIYPDGRPEIVNPQGSTTFRVEVEKITKDPRSGSGRLHYNAGGGWNTVLMREIEPHVYEAEFPAFDCLTEVRFYLSARTVDDEEVTDPNGAPDNSFSAVAATGLAVLFEDDFERDLGWTVENIDLTDGAWERGVPIGGGTRGDPPTDFDGSGQCYLTGNRPGNSDVDGGPTILTSPRFAVSTPNATLYYARWFYSVNGVPDRFTVEISNDDGSNWRVVEDIPHVGERWVERSFRIADFVTPSSQMRVRFIAIDNPNDSITEAAIDAVRIFEYTCDPDLSLTAAGECPGAGTISWSGADAGSTLGLLFARNTGSIAIGPGNPCAGTILGLGSNQLQLVRTFNAGNGAGAFNVTYPGGALRRLPATPPEAGLYDKQRDADSVTPDIAPGLPGEFV